VSAITQKNYDELISAIETHMRTAHAHQTARKLHRALNEARSERFEAQPPVIEILFNIGAVEDQPTK
jgi:hypothetical protein